MVSFERTGRFWLPGSESEEVAGVLTFDRDDGGNLALIGALYDDAAMETPRSVDQLILGFAGRADVTLIGCLLKSSNRPLVGWLEETWRPHIILSGAALDSPDQLAFDHIYFELDGLLEWTERVHIDRDFRVDDARRLNGVVIQHDTVPPEEVELDDGSTLSIEFPWATEGDGVRDSTVRQRCVIHRSWPQPLPLGDVLDEARLFQHLLTIGVNEACSFRTITLQHPDVIIERGDRVYREPIELFGTRQGKPLAKVPHPINMLFRLDDLGGVEGLSKWHRVATQHARALDMAASVRYAPGLFGENKLANTTGAVEALHRVLVPGKAIADDAYDPIKEAMLATVKTGRYRGHLRTQLSHVNEHFLSTRLRDLAAHAAPASGSVVGENVGRWARVVTAVRNELTHPDDADRKPEDERPEVTGSDLLLLSESVYLVVMLCILREAGLGKEAMLSAVSKMSVVWATQQVPEIIERLWPLAEPPS